jgi:hypothetical protein
MPRAGRKAAVSLVALTAALWVAAPAFAQDAAVRESRYQIVFMAQSFDGAQERATTQKAGFARLRRGDQSWIAVDYGPGAVATRRGAALEAGKFESTTDVELGVLYDYATGTLSGNPTLAAFHNGAVRPLLNRGPAAGADGRWSVAVDPASLGLPGLSGPPLDLVLSRTHFTHDGVPLVLVRFKIDGFAYAGPVGAVTQWAEGAALASPDFSTIHWSASRHGAVAVAADGAGRPYGLDLSTVAVDDAGRPLLKVEDIPELADILPAFAGDARGAVSEAAVGLEAPDQTPLMLAARLDVLAHSLGENSANQLGETLGGWVFGQSGTTQADGAGSPAQTAAQGVIADWNVPDKVLAFIDALGGMAPAERERAFLAQFGDSARNLERMMAYAERHSAATQALATEARSIKAELDLVTGFMNRVRTRLDNTGQLTRMLDAELRTSIVDALTGTVRPNSGQLATPLAQLRALERTAASLQSRLTGLNASLVRHTAESAKLAAYVEKAKAVTAAVSRLGVTSGTGLLNLAGKFGEVAQRLGAAKVFSALGTVGNLAGIYDGINRVRNFDPTKAGELPLSRDYSSVKGFGVDLGLTLLGTGSNFAAGNIKGVLLDLASMTSGKVADIYIAAEAASTADMQADAAQQRYLETLARSLRLANEKRLAEFREAADRLGRNIDQLNTDLNNRRPNPARDPNWRDPRFDPATGRPIPSYWAWLKTNNPDALRRMGIDPDAPVGGWPNGVRPEDRPRRTAQQAQPRQPGGPSYPTARQSTRRRPAADPAGPNIPPPSDWTPPGRTRQASFTPRPRSQPTRLSGNFDFTPVSFTPVTFDPVTFDPVTFEPVTWDAVTFDPPEWVPVTFKPPKASSIDWTDFGDGGGWPKRQSNMAYDFADLDGTVETDLSPFEDWLATQDMRHLLDLARAAGYPNLASALRDAENLMRRARDTGFRQWAWSPGVATGAIGLWASEGQHDLARAQVLLGDLLGQSRGIFSTGGFSDIGIRGLNLAYLLRDFGLQDGDIIDIEITQFGRVIFTTRLSLLNAGTSFVHGLRPGVAQMIITAVNEGSASPNTAEIQIDDVVRGEDTQQYSLRTGQSATLRIEANAKAEGGQ